MRVALGQAGVAGPCPLAACPRRNPLVSECQFSLHGLFVNLREFGLGFDAQASGIVEQLVDALSGNLAVEQFAHTRLRLAEDDLQVFL